MAVVSVQERLRERAHDEWILRGVLPRAVVPPLDIARMEPVLRRASVGEIAVHVVEPCALSPLLDAVDRADVPPAVTRLDFCHTLEPLRRSQAGRNVRHVEHMRTAIARHPDDRAA